MGCKVIAKGSVSSCVQIWRNVAPTAVIYRYLRLVVRTRDATFLSHLASPLHWVQGRPTNAIKMSSSAWSKQHAVALINTPFRAFACHTVIQAIQATQATQAIQAIQATQAIMILPWSLYWSDDRTERLLAKWYRIW